MESKAVELDSLRPSGTYSGSTDEIIYQLITDYCDYVTLNLIYDATYTTDFAMGIAGNYYGTYDFKDIDDMTEEYYYGSCNLKTTATGAIPSWFTTTVEYAGGTVRVVDEYKGHKKCLKQYMPSDSQIQAFREWFLTGPSYWGSSGSFQIWFCAEDTGDDDDYIFFSLANIGTVYIKGDDDVSVDGVGDIMSFTDDTWHFMSIDFDMTSGGGWQGLAQDKWQVVIDGTTYGPYDTSGGFGEPPAGNECHGFTHAGHGGGSGWTVYIDSYGWYSPDSLVDPDYFWNDALNPYDITPLKDRIDDNGSDNIAITAMQDKGGDCYIKNEAVIGDHYDVIKLYDNDASDHAETTYHLKSDQTSGTVEFWIRTTDATKEHYVHFYDGSTLAFSFIIEDDKFRHDMNGGEDDSAGVGTPSDDTWYHVRIEFNSDDDEFTYYINGVVQSDGALTYKNVCGDIDSITFATDSSDSGYSMYYDSLGFSWDTKSHSNEGYNVGDNTNKYDVENFKNEDDGFTFDSCLGGYIVTQDLHVSHARVVRINDASATLATTLTHDLNGDQVYGSIEFFIQSSDVTKENNVMVYHGTTTILGFQIDETKFKYWKNDSTWADLSGVGTPANDTWYRVTIDFESGAGTWQSLAPDKYTICVDGTEQDSGADFDLDTAVDHVDTIKFFTGTTDTGYDMYIDALGYQGDSWGGGYERGDNSAIEGGGVETGTEMGSITFAGDKTIRRIIDEYATLDEFIWYLSPIGGIYYNSGGNDSGVDINEGSGIWSVEANQLIKGINRVEILGGIQDDGTQASGSDDDLTAQGTDGIIVYKDTDASLRTDALCEAKATAILDNISDPPLEVFFSKDIDSNGYILCGENYTFAYNSTEMPEISSDQYIIYSTIIDLIREIYDTRIINGLYFREKVDKELVQENSQMIQQNSAAIAELEGGGLQNIVEDLTPQLGGDLDMNGKGIDFPSTANITDVKDENDMASDSATMLATQQSIKAYVDGAAGGISDIVEDVTPTLGGNLDLNTMELSSSSSIKIKPSSDNDDYFELYTSAAIPRIKVVGGSDLHIESDGDDTVLTLNESVDDAAIHVISQDDTYILLITGATNKATMYYDLGEDAFLIKTYEASTPIRIMPSGDSDDYLEFSTDTTNPIIDIIGGGELLFKTAGTERLSINASGLLLGNTGARVTTIADEDAMGSNSATMLATQQSIKAYTDTKCTAAEAHAYVEANALALTANLTTNGLIDGVDIAALKSDCDNQCTTAEAHAYVEANALTLTQNVTFNAGQTFDGKDVSGLCTTAEAHAYVEANEVTFAVFPITPSAAPDANYEVANKKYVDDASTGDASAHLMIGSSNSAWIPCIASLDNSTSQNIFYFTGTYMTNVTSTDGGMMFVLPIPTNRGGKKLYVTGTRVTLSDADANDYITATYTFSHPSGGGAATQLLSDGTNRTSAGTYTYDYADVDCSGAVQVVTIITCVLTSNANLDCYGMELECYYDD